VIKCGEQPKILSLLAGDGAWTSRRWRTVGVEPEMDNGRRSGDFWPEDVPKAASYLVNGGVEGGDREIER